MVVATVCAVAIATHLAGCGRGAVRDVSRPDRSDERSAQILGRLVEAPTPQATGPVGVPGARVFAVDLSSGDTVAETRSEDDGIFRLSLPPGSYLVHGPKTRRYLSVAAGQQVSVQLTVPREEKH
jgi:hypothetical protein